MKALSNDNLATWKFRSDLNQAIDLKSKIELKKSTYALKTPHVLFLLVVFLSFFFCRSIIYIQSRFLSRSPDIVYGPIFTRFETYKTLLTGSVATPLTRPLERVKALVAIYKSRSQHLTIRVLYTQTHRQTMAKLLHPSRQRRGV